LKWFPDMKLIRNWVINWQIAGPRVETLR